MVDRIREILTGYQLTPTQFADAIGTARPIISHILSGRNKPSLEVVQRIIEAFPDLSLPWLLSGTGPMQAAKTTSASAAMQAEPPTSRAKGPEKPSAMRSSTKQASVAPSSQTAPAAAVASLPPIEVAASLSLAAEPAVDEPVPAARPLAVPAQEPIKVPAQAPVLPAPEADTLKAISEPGKSIRRIVIFYSDGTITDYQPEAFSA